VSELSKKAQELLDEIKLTDGIEWNHCWDETELNELIMADLVDVGPKRGPQRAWSRVVPKGTPIT
jgi:hypothetical protein